MCMVFSSIVLVVHCMQYADFKCTWYAVRRVFSVNGMQYVEY